MSKINLVFQPNAYFRLIPTPTGFQIIDIVTQMVVSDRTVIVAVQDDVKNLPTVQVKATNAEDPVGTSVAFGAIIGKSNISAFVLTTNQHVLYIFDDEKMKIIAHISMGLPITLVHINSTYLLIRTPTTTYVYRFQDMKLIYSSSGGESDGLIEVNGVITVLVDPSAF